VSGAAKAASIASEPHEDAVVRWGNGAFFTRCPSGWIGWGTTAELLGPGPWPWLRLTTFMAEHYGPHHLLVKQQSGSRPGNYCWFPGCEQIAYDHECADHRRDEDEPSSGRATAKGQTDERI
jgi:hypothetical protein